MLVFWIQWNENDCEVLSSARCRKEQLKMERANFSMSSGGSAVPELPAGVGSGVEDVLLIDPPEA